jgi:hypothetical protein
MGGVVLFAVIYRNLIKFLILTIVCIHAFGTEPLLFDSGDNTNLLCGLFKNIEGEWHETNTGSSVVFTPLSDYVWCSRFGPFSYTNAEYSSSQIAMYFYSPDENKMCEYTLCNDGREKLVRSKRYGRIGLNKKSIVWNSIEGRTMSIWQLRDFPKHSFSVSH